FWLNRKRQVKKRGDHDNHYRPCEGGSTEPPAAGEGRRGEVGEWGKRGEGDRGEGGGEGGGGGGQGRSAIIARLPVLLFSRSPCLLLPSSPRLPVPHSPRPTLELTRLADEAVAAARDCLNINVAVRALAESLSEQVDILRQVAFVNHAVGPDQLHQIVFPEYLPTVPDQHEQRIHGLRRQRQRLAIAQQQAVRDINAECAEFVEVFEGIAHERSEK